VLAKTGGFDIKQGNYNSQPQPQKLPKAD